MRFLFSLLLICSGFSSATTYAQIEITDSHGKYRFAQPPKRVVVLNWALTEQLLELGVTPLGVADIEGYQKHANKPVINDSTLDVGTRLKPNLDKIRELKPDVILIGYSQRPLIKSLSNIGTVIYFKNFGQRYNNYEKSRERFLELAKLFDKTQYAEQRLSQLDADLLALKTSLEQHYKQTTKTSSRHYPSILFSVTNQTKNTNNGMWVFGNNSMPYYAAEQLGLTIVDAGETDKFGVTRLTSRQLHDTLVRETERLESSHFAPINNMTICRFELSSFATNATAEADIANKSHCRAELAFQNPFGGTMSVLYLAQAVHDALIGERLKKR